MNQELLMNPNCLVAALEKPAAEFTKADIISFIQKNNIRMVNFMYPAADGRLKTLNFVINNAAYLDAILTCGERVDGSSLFPFIEAGSSDLYVVPRFRTAFVDPFAEIPTLSMLCSFFNKDGEPLESSPEHICIKRVKHLLMSQVWSFRRWVSWNTMLFHRIQECFRLQINAVIMNLLRMLSLTISVHSVCRI